MSANKCLEKTNFSASEHFAFKFGAFIFIYTHEFTCQFFDQSKTRSLKRSEIFFRDEINNKLKLNRGNFSFHNYRVENVIKQLVHTSAVLHRDMKHVALGYASSNSYASFMLSKLPACFISPWGTLIYEPIVHY